MAFLPCSHLQHRTTTAWVPQLPLGRGHHALADARHTFRHALLLDESSTRAHLGMCVADLAENRLDAAKHSARVAITFCHHLPMAHFHLGTILARKGQFLMAIRSLETCLAQRPDTPAAHRLLARIFSTAVFDSEKEEYHRRQTERVPGSNPFEGNN
jgi:Tfp pilus assembly protein PilF